MEEVRLSWLDKWFLFNNTISMNTVFDIRIHYADGIKQDIKGKGCDDIILFIITTTEKEDVLWITQYPQIDNVSIGIQKRDRC